METELIFRVSETVSASSNPMVEAEKNNAVTVEASELCEISSSHGGEYDVQSCLLGYTAV
jgi:hypothetical protein